jgi:hypothetical protein
MQKLPDKAIQDEAAAEAGERRQWAWQVGAEEQGEGPGGLYEYVNVCVHAPELKLICL